MSEPSTSTESTATPPTLESLQEKALELLRNPAVKAGGAILVSLLIARLAAGSKLRNGAVQVLRNLLTTKILTSLVTPPHGSAEVPPPAAAPPPQQPPPPAGTSQTEATFAQLGRQIFEAVAPQLGEVAKKKLAEVFRPRQ